MTKPAVLLHKCANCQHEPVDYDVPCAQCGAILSSTGIYTMTAEDDGCYIEGINVCRYERTETTFVRKPYVKVRPHRGGIAESMELMQEVMGSEGFINMLVAVPLHKQEKTMEKDKLQELLRLIYPHVTFVVNEWGGIFGREYRCGLTGREFRLKLAEETGINPGNLAPADFINQALEQAQQLYGDKL